MMVRLDGREHEKDLTHWKEVNQVFLQVTRAQDWTKSVREEVGGRFFLPFQMEGVMPDSGLVCVCVWLSTKYVL